MKVLKFGGSSVANSKNIKQVLDIISNTSKKCKLAVIVSAFGKTTDNLLLGANKALEDITSAKEILEKLSVLHFSIISDLIINKKKKTHQEVKYLFDRLASIYEGIFLLQELSDKTLAKVSSIGERLSSVIIANAAKENLDAIHQDSRDLIITNNDYLNAQVNFKVTNKNISSFFSIYLF